MKIDISSVVKSIKDRIDLDLSVNKDELSEITPFKDLRIELVTPMVFVGALTNIDGAIKLSGEANVKYTTLCARCGVDVSSVMKFTIDEKLMNEADLKEDEREDFFYYSGNDLDIGKILSEYFYLNLPMREICSEACKGRCSKCGVNLNKEACACMSINANSQFEALKDFFK